MIFKKYLGKWTPLTWNTYPKVELQMVREIKEPTEQVQLVDNIDKNTELVNYKDFVHAFLKEKKINEEYNKQNLWGEYCSNIYIINYFTYSTKY